MSKKRKDVRVPFNIWLRVGTKDNPGEDDEVYAVLTHFRNEIRKQYPADTSDHEINKIVFSMAFRSLAKNKRPDLLMPRERSDDLLARLAASMNEMAMELSDIRTQIENGVQVNLGNIDKMQQLASSVQPEKYTPFEQSIGDGFVSFGDDDED